MKISRVPLTYAIAFVLGIISEFIGFQIERLMISGGVPARVGFPVSLFIFVAFPFLTTGVIAYKVSKDYLIAIILSTMVIPSTLLLIQYLGI